MSGEDPAKRVARLLPTRFLRGYAAGKLRTDPIYAAVAARLRGSSIPIYDIGCGVGLTEFYLRELGMNMPMTGVDHDERKISVACEIATRYRDLTFRTGDARDAIPPGSVLALDVLHYFRDEEQISLLRSIAEAVPPGGVAVVRDAVRDGSLRYKVTAAQETFSRAIRWLRAERLNFPLRDTVIDPFRARGFDVEAVPLWGRTPFNNYLFVFRRPGSGTTIA